MDRPRSKGGGPCQLRCCKGRRGCICPPSADVLFRADAGVVLDGTSASSGARGTVTFRDGALQSRRLGSGPGPGSDEGEGSTRGKSGRPSPTASSAGLRPIAGHRSHLARTAPGGAAMNFTSFVAQRAGGSGGVVEPRGSVAGTNKASRRVAGHGVETSGRAAGTGAEPSGAGELDVAREVVAKVHGRLKQVPADRHARVSAQVMGDVCRASGVPGRVITSAFTQLGVRGFEKLDQLVDRDMALTSLCCFVKPKTTRSSIRYALEHLQPVSVPKFARMFELVSSWDPTAGPAEVSATLSAVRASVSGSEPVVVTARDIAGVDLGPFGGSTSGSLVPADAPGSVSEFARAELREGNVMDDARGAGAQQRPAGAGAEPRLTGKSSVLASEPNKADVLGPAAADTAPGGLVAGCTGGGAAGASGTVGKGGAGAGAGAAPHPAVAREEKSLRFWVLGMPVAVTLEQARQYTPGLAESTFRGLEGFDEDRGLLSRNGLLRYMATPSTPMPPALHALLRGVVRRTQGLAGGGGGGSSIHTQIDRLVAPIGALPAVKAGDRVCVVPAAPRTPIGVGAGVGAGAGGSRSTPK